MMKKPRTQSDAPMRGPSMADQFMSDEIDGNLIQEPEFQTLQNRKQDSKSKSFASAPQRQGSKLKSKRLDTAKSKNLKIRKIATSYDKRKEHLFANQKISRTQSSRSFGAYQS